MTAKSVRKRWQLSASEAPSSCLSNSRANKTRKGPSTTGGFFREPFVETLLDGADQSRPGQGVSPLTEGMHDGDKIRDLQVGSGTRIVKKLKHIIFAAFTVSPLPAPHLAIRRPIAHTHSH